MAEDPTAGTMPARRDGAADALPAALVPGVIDPLPAKGRILPSHEFKCGGAADGRRSAVCVDQGGLMPAPWSFAWLEDKAYRGEALALTRKALREGRPLSVEDRAGIATASRKLDAANGLNGRQAEAILAILAELDGAGSARVEDGT